MAAAMTRLLRFATAVAVTTCAAAVAAAPAYSDADGRLFLSFASAAYCPASKLQPWSCNLDVCKTHPRMNSTVVYDKGLDIQALIAHDPDSPTGTIWVAFRGTVASSLKDWIDDLDFVKTSYPTCASSGCEVHRGFYRSFRAVAGPLLEHVHWLRAKHPSAPLRVTGHSLGGALAQLAALAMAEAGMSPAEVLTFGSPRVGNAAFAKYFAASMTTAPHYRVTHNADPVPHVPPKSFGFRHTPTEVFYDAPSTHYKTCDGSGEDKSCADGVLLPVKVADHLSYLGWNITARTAMCNS
mmetsp:Transcript_17260/g.60642  ORF Transcript_17260/g.60642 Transcript_17260/m.60642 type:complete len:296 (-) Transcript_17260:4542-5429(-)